LTASSCLSLDFPNTGFDLDSKNVRHRRNMSLPSSGWQRKLSRTQQGGELWESSTGKQGLAQARVSACLLLSLITTLKMETISYSETQSLLRSSGLKYMPCTEATSLPRCQTATYRHLLFILSANCACSNGVQGLALTCHVGNDLVRSTISVGCGDKAEGQVGPESASD
jgi:hypothetical protein